MKQTGIIRRIDDLGRIVVPKEIRKNLRIREGDPVEIFTNNEGQIILKKYSVIGEMTEFAGTYAEAMSLIAGHKVIVTDRDQIIAVAGGVKKENIGKKITKELEEAMEKRQSMDSKKTGKILQVAEGMTVEIRQQIIYPIICDSDVAGSVIIFDKENMLSETENKIAGVAAAFLGKQIGG